MKKQTETGKARLFPRFKVWFSSREEEGVFGDGKWRLLMEIERGKSIRAAALSLGMSYRKAWGDLKKAEACLGVKLIEKHRGGADGGETNLTCEGKKWLAAYTGFRMHLEKAVKRGFEKYLENL